MVQRSITVSGARNTGDIPESMIKDIQLAPSGHKKIDWVSQHMPVLNTLRSEFQVAKPLAGLRVAICLHLEAKTAYLAQTLHLAGADVFMCASNPLSTQDDIVSALVDSGITCFAWYNASAAEYGEHMNSVLNCHPDALIDDGADLVSLLHQNRIDQAKTIIGGCEETTTGILRLKSMEREGTLLFPMMAVNDAYMKYLFDNRYGTGQSVWDGIMRTTNLVVSGKTVVVAGYGWCGKGVSMRARGLGARVVVTEIDPIKASEALMDGFLVMTMKEACSLGDIFITVTGNIDVIRKEHFHLMKDGALLANAGHFDVEICKPDLYNMTSARRTIKNNIEEFTFHDGRRVYLLADGRLVNLAAGDGHPAEVMDLSFSLQALSLLHVVENAGQLKPLVYSVPEEIDQKVAKLRLNAIGVTIDKLSTQQAQYLKAWK